MKHNSVHEYRSEGASLFSLDAASFLCSALLLELAIRDNLIESAVCVHPSPSMPKFSVLFHILNFEHGGSPTGNKASPIR